MNSIQIDVPRTHNFRFAHQAPSWIGKMFPGLQQWGWRLGSIVSSCCPRFVVVVVLYFLMCSFRAFHRCLSRFFTRALLSQLRPQILSPFPCEGAIDPPAWVHLPNKLRFSSAGFTPHLQPSHLFPLELSDFGHLQLELLSRVGDGARVLF